MEKTTLIRLVPDVLLIEVVIPDDEDGHARTDTSSKSSHFGWSRAQEVENCTEETCLFSKKQRDDKKKVFSSHHHPNGKPSTDDLNCVNCDGKCRCLCVCVGVGVFELRVEKCGFLLTNRFWFSKKASTTKKSSFVTAVGQKEGHVRLMASLQVRFLIVIVIFKRVGGWFWHDSIPRTRWLAQTFNRAGMHILLLEWVRQGMARKYSQKLTWVYVIQQHGSTWLESKPQKDSSSSNSGPHTSVG